MGVEGVTPSVSTESLEQMKQQTTSLISSSWILNQPPHNPNMAAYNKKKVWSWISIIYVKVVERPITTINDAIPHTWIDMKYRTRRKTDLVHILNRDECCSLPRCYRKLPHFHVRTRRKHFLICMNRDCDPHHSDKVKIFYSTLSFAHINLI